MKKLLNIIIWTGLISAIVLVVIVIYWLTYPYKIAEQFKPAKILTPVIKRGDDVYYELDFCKYINISPISTRRQLVNGLVYPLPNSEVRVLSTGCKKVTASAPIIIPDCAECYNKNVHLELITTYQINPLRRMEVKFITEDFIIIK